MDVCIYAWSFVNLFLLMLHAVTETETINLLLGNNNCTCVNIECQGALYIVISNNDPNQEDILCPVYTSRTRSCYNPSTCHEFESTPFFRICENSSDGLECMYNMCFENITEQLNGTRLDFFILNRIICAIGPYFTRIYIKSFELRGIILLYENDLYMTCL